MNERTLYLAALDITDPAERSAYLDRACAGNLKLRRQVDALLAADARSGEFLDVPALRQMADAPDVTQTFDYSEEEAEFELGYLTPSTKEGSLGTLGHYEVLKVLGQGGFGTVLKAFDEKLHRLVAIKVLSRQLAATSPPRKRFLREARAVAAIKHENVVQVYSVEEQPLPYLVMELVEGSTLQDKMNEAGPLGVPEVLHIGRQIAAGLAAAHALGLIHRDIKPGNILLEKGVVQKVKITDFGLARTADDASLSQSGTIAGTPLYMAPEQANGSKLDPRADLFSLGSVLYALTCGHPPFRAPTTLAVLRRVAEDAPRPLQEIIPETPDWLVAIVDKLLAKEPDDRFQSAHEVADLLGLCQSKLHAGVAPTAVSLGLKPATVEPVSTATAKVEPKRKRFPVAAIAAGIVLMVAVTATGLYFLNKNKDQGTVAAIPPETPADSATPATSAEPTLLSVAPIFNGKDLTNWLMVGHPGWSVKDGILTGETSGPPGMLLSNMFFLDYELTLEFKLSSGSRTGVFLRAWSSGHVSGKDFPRIQLFDNGARPAIGETARNDSLLNIAVAKEASLKPDEWHSLRVRVIGDTVTEWINGEQVLAAKLPQGSPMATRLGLQLSQERVDFRALYVKLVVTPETAAVDRKAAEAVIRKGGTVGLAFNDPKGYANFEAVDKLPSTPFALQSVSWRDCKQVSDDDLQLISGSSVRILSLGGTSVRGPGLKHLASCKQLAMLYGRHDAEWTDDDYAPLKACPLRILHTGIDRVGAPTLTWLAEKDGLTELTIGNVKFTDADLQILERATSLKRFVVHANSMVSKAGITRLSAALPNCKIEVFDPASTFTNTLGMEFVKVPKGTGWLGGGAGKQGETKVVIEQDFYIGKYEVTQAEWESVTGQKPSHFSRTGDGKDAVKDIPDADLKRFPVDTVSWHDCQLFIKKLNEKEKDTGWIYRLPTEAEWEYACRGGPGDKVDSAFDFYFVKPTNTLLPTQANVNKTIGRTSKVGSYAPSALALHDIHGNVSEYCEGKDGTIVIRGGSWDRNTDECRTSYALVISRRDVSFHGTGLRLVRVPVGPVVAVPAPTDPDRKAAEWVLANGGKVQVAPGGNVFTLDKLPTHKFSLGLISFGGLKFKDEQELECLANLAQLEQVFLGQAPITGLRLHYIARCPEIVVLALDSTAVRDGDLGVLKNLKKLQNLSLHNTRTSDAGIEHILECPRLTQLDLSLTGITDAGLKKLEVLKELKSVYVDQTKVSAEGVKKLAAALPGCKIRWDGGVIEPTSTVDPDRRAAEWVLSIGGWVKVNGQEKEIKALDELPKGNILLTAIVLGKKFTDADLVVFQGSKNLVELLIPFTPVTDAGLVHFKDNRNLKVLDLKGTAVTDAGLAHFKDCTNLTDLRLYGTTVTDAGFAHFKDCKRLASLCLEGTKITDKGLAHFAGCKDLYRLNLDSTPVTGAGFIHFKDCTKLTFIQLPNTQVASGLANFKRSKPHGINLAGTPIGDEGLKELEQLQKLPGLNVTKTKVTAAGIERLTKALPLCVIEWDGGLIDPTGASDRKAAEWAISVGGKIQIDGINRSIAKASELPAKSFRLTQIELVGNSKVTDEGLAHCAGCNNLLELNLSDTLVTDAGMVHFKACRQLQMLSLHGTVVTANGLEFLNACADLTYFGLKGEKLKDDSLAHLKTCKKLKEVDIRGQRLVTDAGLAYLKDCKDLERLLVDDTKVTDATLALFKDHNFDGLELSGTQVTDGGLAHLKTHSNLRILKLDGTQVTDTGLAHLKNCKKLTHLQLGGARITDAGLAHLKDCNLTTLWVHDTPLTDDSIAVLSSFHKLKSLTVKGTKITESGVKKLAAALPLCNIGWNGGAIERNK